jgi:uncharacterized BrkB/YihY/UPF0761 family membrane protein
MADTRFAPQPFRKWFWYGALAVLLFMLVGVGGYLATVMTPIEQMPADHQAVMAAMPGWQIPVVSLLAAVGTFLPYAVVPAVRELATEGDAVAAIIVIALCWTSFWFARHSQQKGWLK